MARPKHHREGFFIPRPSVNLKHKRRKQLIEKRTEIYEIELSRWAELVGLGTQNAVVGLSEMVGAKIKITALDLKVIPVTKAAELVGGPENEVVIIIFIFNTFINR